MRTLPQLRVTCETEQELRDVLDFIENQDACTVEFGTEKRSIGTIVTITPYSKHSCAAFQNFCTQLDRELI